MIKLIFPNNFTRAATIYSTRYSSKISGAELSIIRIIGSFELIIRVILKVKFLFSFGRLFVFVVILWFPSKYNRRSLIYNT